MCASCFKKEVRALTPTDRVPMPSPRAIDTDDALSLPSVPSQPPYPGCTCARCGATESGQWVTATTGEHAGKHVCTACYWREKRANAKRR